MLASSRRKKMRKSLNELLELPANYIITKIVITMLIMACIGNPDE